MLAAVRSAAVLGVDPFGVIVEVDAANGLPQWSMVGTEPLQRNDLTARLDRAARRPSRGGRLLACPPSVVAKPWEAAGAGLRGDRSMRRAVGPDL